MPSLKEVDTITANDDKSTTAQQVESSSGGGSTKSLNNDSTKNGAPTAIVKTTNHTSLQEQPSTKQIQYEDPSKVPPDETSFTTRPHFNPQNEFHVNLRNFDLSYRCSICYEIYTNPVMLVSCMHNFCSLCIHNHLKNTYTGMKRKADCPICNVEVKLPGGSNNNSGGYEKGIIPNTHLSQQVTLYKSCGIRDDIRSSLVRLDVLEQEKRLGMFDSSCGKGISMDEDEVGTSKKKKRDEEDKSLRCSKRSRRQTTSTAAAMKRANDSSDDDDSNEDEDYNDENAEVDDGDEDTTYKNSKMPASSSTKPTTVNTKLKRKPLVSYHNLNKKKLVELCSREGLDVTGNETQLKQRHSDFITLYNSECDSEQPRSVKELVKELKNREKHIKIEANRPIPKKQSKYMKNLSNTLGAFNDGSIDRPTCGDASFDTELKTNFAAMIANVKKRKMEASSSSSSSVAAHGEHEYTNVHGSGSPHELKNCDSDKEAASAATSLLSYKTEEMDNNVSSPTASIDSDKTVETPNKLCQMKSKKQPTKQPPPKTKFSTKKKKQAAPKSANKANIRTTASRIISYGPWTCNVCTFENLRNTSKSCPCEMCDNPRPKEKTLTLAQPKDDAEVVNIDC